MPRVGLAKVTGAMAIPAKPEITPARAKATMRAPATGTPRRAAPSRFWAMAERPRPHPAVFANTWSPPPVTVGGYHVFAKYSRWGLGLSAMAQNREGAALRGVPVAGARIVAFALAGVISGLAGIAIAPVTFANPTLGINYALKGFVAMAIGGFGSTTGALLGARCSA